MISAFTTGAAAALAGTHAWRQPAAKSVFCSYSEDLSPGIIKPLGGLTPNKSYAAWQADPKGVGSVFSRLNIVMTIGRNSLMILHPVIDTWFQEVRQE